MNEAVSEGRTGHFLATDRDREGEAIKQHLREAIGGDESRYRRVVFNEITRKAIQDAFVDPGDIDMDRLRPAGATIFGSSSGFRVVATALGKGGPWLPGRGAECRSAANCRA